MGSIIGREDNLVLFLNNLSLCAFKIEPGRELLPRLIERVVDFLSVDLRNNIERRHLWLRIVFGNLDVAVLGLELKGRFTAAADQHVDLVNWFGPSLLLLRKIIGNFTGGGVCDQVKCRFGWNVSKCIAVLDGGVNRELTILPPLVNDYQMAGLETEVEIAETIMREQSAIAQLCPRLIAAHFVQLHFTVGQL